MEYHTPSGIKSHWFCCPENFQFSYCQDTGNPGWAIIKKKEMLMLQKSSYIWVYVEGCQTELRLSLINSVDISFLFAGSRKMYCSNRFANFYEWFVPA